MYGAILGDIIGSTRQFDLGEKTKQFDLFEDESRFTDDTVMTIAIADVLLNNYWSHNMETMKKKFIISMQDWHDVYPNVGYGAYFHRWLQTTDPQPYNSFGNGAASRVAAVGWLNGPLSFIQMVARLTAEISHNHIQGIKGAETVATCIWLARHEYDKNFIKQYVEEKFKYDLTQSLENIRPTYRHVESCQQTVPQAIIAFLESQDFEDAIRNAVSIGGDSDTIAAITGSIAEAYYGVSDELKAECRDRLPSNILSVLQKFDLAFENDNGINRNDLCSDM